MASVKQQLIQKLEEKAAELESEAMTYRMDANVLRRRGSGKLPGWATRLADRWGIRA